MSSLMVRPSSRITSCTCSAISGGREKVIVLVFLLMSLLVIYCLTIHLPVGRLPALRMEAQLNGPMKAEDRMEAMECRKSTVETSLSLLQMQPDIEDRLHQIWPSLVSVGTHSLRSGRAEQLK